MGLKGELADELLLVAVTTSKRIFAGESQAEIKLDGSQKDFLSGNTIMMLSGRRRPPRHDGMSWTRV